MKAKFPELYQVGNPWDVPAIHIVFSCFRLAWMVIPNEENIRQTKYIYVQNYIVKIHRMLRKLINLKLIWCSLVSSSVYSLFNRNLHGVDTNGLVQRAINASNVYENIAGYIEEANKAALLALNTTNRVNDVSSCHNTSIYFAMLQGLWTPEYEEKTRFSFIVCIKVLTAPYASYIISWIKS